MEILEKIRFITSYIAMYAALASIFTIVQCLVAIYLIDISDDFAWLIIFISTSTPAVLLYKNKIVINEYKFNH